jgi:hypothetical protein
VDVIAAFPEVGYLDKSFWGDKKIQGAVVGLILLSFFYLIVYLDSFIISKN